VSRAWNRRWWRRRGRRGTESRRLLGLWQLETGTVARMCRGKREWRVGMARVCLDPGLGLAVAQAVRRGRAALVAKTVAPPMMAVTAMVGLAAPMPAAAEAMVGALGSALAAAWHGLLRTSAFGTQLLGTPVVHHWGQGQVPCRLLCPSHSTGRLQARRASLWWSLAHRVQQGHAQSE
jgi:hypothetical protein